MKTVLITGATKGIGRATARRLLGLGHCVWIGAREKTAATVAAAELGDLARPLAIDVTDDASIREAVRVIQGQGGGLDVLVNNAAVLLDGEGDLFSLTSETLRLTLETNLLGPLRVSQAFIPLLRASGCPRIVNLSSGAGQLSDGLSAWAPAYSLSKTALNMLTQQLAASLPKFAVNSVCPGWCRTAMGGQHATRSAEEGADAVVWLAVDAPQCSTGLFFRDRKVIDW